MAWQIQKAEEPGSEAQSWQGPALDSDLIGGASFGVLVPLWFAMTSESMGDKISYTFRVLVTIGTKHCLSF